MGRSEQTYSEKLKDPRWHLFRQEFMARRRRKYERPDECDECGQDTRGALHVHHRLYRDGADPWEYEDEELRLLCEFCHERIHAVEEQARNLIRRIPSHVCYEFGSLLDALEDCFEVGDHSLKVALARCKNEAIGCYFAHNLSPQQEANLNSAMEEYDKRKDE